MTSSATPMTISDIHARCTELGDCWLWQGSRTSTGHPIMPGPLRRVLVRRYVWQLLGHELPERGHVLKATCGESLCCNPAHLAVWSRSRLMADAYVSSRNTVVEYAARRAGRIKQGGTKVTLEVARRIRVDTRAAEAIAREIGISPSMVRKIRSGQCWRDVAPGAWVFSWRP